MMAVVLCLLSISSIARTSCWTGSWLNLNYSPCEIKCLRCVRVAPPPPPPHSAPPINWSVDYTGCAVTATDVNHIAELMRQYDSLLGFVPLDWNCQHFTATQTSCLPSFVFQQLGPFLLFFFKFKNKNTTIIINSSDQQCVKLKWFSYLSLYKF